MDLRGRSITSAAQRLENLATRIDHTVMRVSVQLGRFGKWTNTNVGWLMVNGAFVAGFFLAQLVPSWTSGITTMLCMYWYGVVLTAIYAAVPASKASHRRYFYYLIMLSVGLMLLLIAMQVLSAIALS